MNDWMHHSLLFVQVWDNPVTEKPLLEPLFAAAMQGIELCFLLMGEFVRDSRSYVAKRPRIELLASDIRTQCALLSEVSHYRYNRVMNSI